MKGIVETGILKPVSPREEIFRACRLLTRDGGVHEVRIPKSGRRGTIAGYFNDAERLTEAVLSIDGTVPGIYITLNPVRTDLLARASNRLQEHVQNTTGDNDILQRRWLLLDFDPVRPSGISSSYAEHGRAISAACAAWDDLRGASWPDPVVCDSGNGAHLLYRVTLPNNQESTELVKAILAGVAARCSTDDIVVDRTVFNSSRIVKLYGTMACKGDSVFERPHRRSRLLEIPEKLRILEAA